MYKNNETDLAYSEVEATKLKKLILILSMVFMSNANASFLSGSKLASYLEENETDFGKIYSLGYVVGIFEANEGYEYCAREGITQIQIQKVAHKYLENNPEFLHKPAYKLLLQAFKEVFPCNQPQQTQSTRVPQQKFNKPINPQNARD